ncbi:MAG: sulfotransferase [Mesorhizobium sp.]|uniref:tetratricopeptide repeat-containing sulfotransferase family protein n=1 Tax=Mesorhizobium sp. TaxID=1871066 RepID=UPI001AC71F0D|nr:tetratricopeptide repeat-containing sulfotransferase family protein [Mesorhizobium sp.]MBN9218871.1 sulfotransferase [Mesorhizobium sp.]
MNSRPPPAWAKHIKSGSVARPADPGFKPGLQQAPGLGQANSSKPSSYEQADDLLLKKASELQQANRLDEARELCRQVLARAPNHSLALYMMGILCLSHDDEAALRYFVRAIAEAPTNPYYHLSLGEAYLAMIEYSPAIQHIQRALELQPDLVDALCALGRTYIDSGTPDLALPIYEKALEINRDHPKPRLGMARALISIGRMDDAGSYLKEAIERRIGLARAYNDLAQTRNFTEEPPELLSILNELGRPGLDSGVTYMLHSAAGKILNDLKRYKEAFHHFDKANQAREHRFDIEKHRRWIDALIEIFTPGLFAVAAGYGDPSEAPVFVVGMPRSGTTLTEQILASHPGVHGAGELGKLKRAANAVGLRPGVGDLTQALNFLTPDMIGTLAGEHLSYLRERSPAAQRIVDKMPHNFELIGLIALMFPNARIIHCRRDAIDNCLSCFVLPFSDMHDYNTDQRILGLYYREYDRLMRHWNEVLPGRIFENRYETLVEDQEAQSRRLIDYLGLPWDDACLRFFDRQGSVTTLSRWQVRQPIYKSSVKRWKNYENEIQPLIEALGDLADT